MAATKDRIALGSGDLYCMEYTTKEIPEDELIETGENLLGAIKGGASLEYKAESYTAIDDAGKRSKTIITNETAVLKSGVMTWNGETLKKLCSTARVSTSADGKRRIVKIGGINNADGKKYLVRFHHPDPVDGDCRVTIVGTNQAGLLIAFAKDKEAVINAEFNAEPCDKEGTLIIYEEEIIKEEE